MITIFDIIIFTILAFSSIGGLYRGLIHLVIHLIGFLGSIIGAILLYPYLDTFIDTYVENNILSNTLSGVASYIISFIIFACFSNIVTSFFKIIRLGILDRITGFLVGIIKGIFISVIIFAVSAIFTTESYHKAKKTEDVIYRLESNKYPDWLKNSVTAPYLEDILKASISYVPQQLLDYIKFEQIDKISNDDTLGDETLGDKIPSKEELIEKLNYNSE